MISLLLTLMAVGSEVGWAPNVQVAKSYAEKMDKPIVVALVKSSMAAANLTNVITHPKALAFADKFVYVRVDTEQKMRAVAKIKGFSDHTTVVFANTDGRVLCRVGGMLTVTDYTEAARLALWARREGSTLERNAANRAPIGAEGTQLGLLHAIRGDVKEAKALLTNAEKTGNPAQLSDAYYGLADQYRVLWNFKDAIPPLTKSLAFASTPRQTFRARLRMAICYFRTSSFVKAKQAIEPCLAIADIPKEDRDFAVMFDNRILASLETLKQGPRLRR